MPPAVRVRTSSGWQDIALQGPPGAPGILAADRVLGVYNGYLGPFSPTSENAIWRDAAGTLPLRLTITPAVDCWWDTSMNMGLVQKLDAVYHYGQIALKLAPVDVDGESYAYHYITQHASVQQFESYAPRKMWKLAAGVTYTVSGVFVVSGGSWQYYAGPAQEWIQGIAIPRGLTPQAPVGELELDYVQRTTPFNVVATAEAAPDTLLTLPARVYDGQTRIRVEFFLPRINLDAVAGSTIVFSLYDGATGVSRLLTVNNNAAAAKIDTGVGKLHLTPSAGSHQYIMKAWKSAGTPSLGAGPGTTFNDDPPMFMRTVKIR